MSSSDNRGGVGIEIRLLGRFAVVRDGHEVAPAAFRQSLARRLVRILASRRGEFVSRDFLFESLWPGAAPADPGANLRVLVTLARKALGDPAFIRAASGGYVFSPDDLCSVDSEDFLARLAVAGRFFERESYREALDAYRAALMLWTGEPLAEDAFDEWAHPFRSRLSLAHLHALEGASEAALMAGNAVDAAGWAEQAALREPLRERSNALLIEALAASGDTANALATYERFRQLMAEELGLDPSPETQLLQTRILRGKVRAEAPQPAGPREPPFPRQLAFACSKPFAGRADEVETARRILAKPKDRAGFLWILGEPGIGKTTLAALIAQKAHSQGAVALFGRCTEEFDLPYQPFLEALEWYLLHVPSADLGERPEELVRLVPEIANRIPGLQAPVSRGPEMDQHRLSEAVRSWLVSAGRGGPVVMFIDDVQWADRSTIALLGHLARSSEPSTVWVICTARDPGSEEGLAILNEQIARNLVPSYRLELSGLEPADVEQLVVHAVGRSLDSRLGPFVDELHRDTAGNPLFIESLLRDLAPDAGRLGHGGSIDESVTRRVSRLPGGVRNCLDAASVGGVEFDLSIVAQASGLDEMRTLRSLEGGIRAALIDELSANRYRFRHAVVRSVLLRQLSESRRVRLHLAVAEALERVHRGHLPPASEALAMHFMEALPVGGAGKAYTYTLMAAGEADRLLSHDQAVSSYDRALGLLDRVDRGPLERYELLFAKSRAQRRAGDVLGALESLQEAIREAERHQALPQLAIAAIDFEDANFWLGSPEDESVRILNPVRKRMEATDSPLRARLLAGLARALEHSGEPEAADRAREAAAMAERLGDPRTSYEVNFRSARSIVNVADAHLRAPAWTRLCREAQRFNDTEAYVLALGQAMWAEVMLGNLLAAEGLFAEYSQVALELRQTRWEAWAEVYAALRATIRGRLEEAELYLRRAEAIGESFGWARPGLYGVAMFWIRGEQGRLGEVAHMVRAAAQLNPAEAFWRPGLAAMYLELGQIEDARLQYEDLCDGGLDSLTGDASRELSLALLAQTAAGLGDVTRAGWLMQELLPCRGRMLVFLLSAVCLGPADRLLGLMAALSGQAEAAREWFESALELARRMESPPWVAHTLHDYLLYARPADETAARRMLVEASALCESLGLAALAGRLDRLKNP